MADSGLGCSAEVGTGSTGRVALSLEGASLFMMWHSGVSLVVKLNPTHLCSFVLMENCGTMC